LNFVFHHALSFEGAVYSCQGAEKSALIITTAERKAQGGYLKKLALQI
jgi:hypothetical protein